jgi:U4/U6 small nuclear ribonucleoprotein PRP31
VESNAATAEIGTDIARIHKFVRDHYKPKFPELEQLILNPLDYVKVVMQIKNESDLTQIDLASLLPPATIMVITVTATTTPGKPLSPEELEKVLEGCKIIMDLDEARRAIVLYVESQMGIIAPNLSALVGSAVAAKLMSVAGGLTALSKMPSCNLQLLGASKRTLSGFSNLSRGASGFLVDAAIVQTTPPSLRLKAVRLLAGKCTLAARVDSAHDDTTGSIGAKFLEEVEKRLEKVQEAPPAKEVKALPAPDFQKKARRGGQRMRKIKEKYQMTELRKQANRVAFGTNAQDEVGSSGKGMGLINQSMGTGKLRVSAQDRGILKKRAITGGSSGATSGLSSSLAFTPVQGLELANPQAAAQKVRDANMKYFGTMAFKKE